MMLNLYLIRHGHTVWYETGGVAGVSDIDLSSAGEQAAKALARTWPSSRAINSWYCSPFARTRQTSELLREDIVEKLTIQEDSRLRELNFGDWEGMTWAAVHEQHEQEMKHWGEDWINRAPPNGETFANQHARCKQWLESLYEGIEVEHTAIAVLHGGSIRALVCECLQWPLEQAMGFSVDPATATLLSIDVESRRSTLRMLNSACF